MELINYIIFILLLIKLWEYSYFTIFLFFIGYNILEYISLNGSYLKYKYENTESLPQKIICSFFYGTNIFLVKLIETKNYIINNLIETKLGYYVYLKLNNLNIKFLEFKYNLFYNLTNKLIKIIMSYFENETNEREEKELEKLEQKKIQKTILNSDEEITSFLNEIIDSIND